MCNISKPYLAEMEEGDNMPGTNEGEVMIGSRKFVFISNLRLEPVVAELRPLSQIPSSKREELVQFYREELLVVCIPASVTGVSMHTSLGVITDLGGNPTAIRAEYLQLVSEKSTTMCTTEHLIKAINDRICSEERWLLVA